MLVLQKDYSFFFCDEEIKKEKRKKKTVYLNESNFIHFAHKCNNHKVLCTSCLSGRPASFLLCFEHLPLYKETKLGFTLFPFSFLYSFFLFLFFLFFKIKMVVNAFTLQRKYPQFQVNDINNLIDQFR